MATQEPVAPSSRQPAAQGCDHGQEEPEADVKAAEERAADELKSSRETAASRSDLVAMLVANVILVLGYALAVWFQALEFDGRARETVAVAVYFPAFALLLLSGVIELSVDVFSVRVVGHGRYHSSSARWNRVVSILFIAAGVLDIVAFVYWLRRDFDVEDVVLLISSYVLLAMAILVLGLQVQEIGRQSWKESITSDRIDFVANVLVFVLSVTGVVLRHMQHSPKEAFEERSDRLEMATVPLWLVSSLMYVTADVIRVKTRVADYESD
mmetsp:Transcript_2744/g.6255  ORF Transcript_2744/g.6255 Transcript_2744/m.6255 type:complete len:269 (-) Transcript_2744:434-1240(-)